MQRFGPRKDCAAKHRAMEPIVRAVQQTKTKAVQVLAIWAEAAAVSGADTPAEGTDRPGDDDG